MEEGQEIYYLTSGVKTNGDRVEMIMKGPNAGEVMEGYNQLSGYRSSSTLDKVPSFTPIDENDISDCVKEALRRKKVFEISSSRE
jgi:pyruvate dehydrogenase complex dehydrogenase (E1) component